MKQNLKRVETKIYHFDGVKIEGKNNYMMGYCSGLYGSFNQFEISEYDRTIGINIPSACKIKQRKKRGKSPLKRNKCYTHRSIRMRK